MTTPSTGPAPDPVTGPPTGPVTRRPADPQEVALLVDLLEAEHAAVYGYGVLGGRLAAAQRDDAADAARAADDAHRVRRDSLAARLRERGTEPVAPLPAYAVATPDVPSALALAVRLEEGLAARWLALVRGTDDPALRAQAAAALQESAVRATGWRRRAGDPTPTVALPGATP